MLAVFVLKMIEVVSIIENPIAVLGLGILLGMNVLAFMEDYF
jgi:hypothetical protein